MEGLVNGAHFPSSVLTAAPDVTEGGLQRHEDILFPVCLFTILKNATVHSADGPSFHFTNPYQCLRWARHCAGSGGLNDEKDRLWANHA